MASLINFNLQGFYFPFLMNFLIIKEKGAKKTMFFQHTLKSKELRKVIANVRECLFTASAKLADRDYKVAVYKYNDEYFILNDSRIFEKLEGLSEYIQGDESQLLSYIEGALEENLYHLVKENYICLDLSILAHMEEANNVKIRYYEFIDI